MNSLDIKLRFSDTSIINVSVDPHDSISSLLNYCPEGNFNFLLNGLILLSPFSFQFYSISSGDEINVISQQKQELTSKTSVNHCRKTPTLNYIRQKSLLFYELYGQRPDSETIRTIVQEYFNPDYGNEAARVRDLNYIKITGKTASYRNLINRYKFTVNAPQKLNESKMKPAVISVVSEPSKEALPECWKLRC